MNSHRLDQLKKYYEEDPNDPFIIYGLAMEYWKTDKVTARHYFELLISRFPDYLPTYYQLAHLYEELDEDHLAEDTYKSGIEVAQAQQNINTERELKTALELLMF